MNEKLIQTFMKNLEISREEAIELISDDEDIEKGVAKDFDLTAEQEKNARKARQVARGVSEKPIKRERKPDNTKRELIEILKTAVSAVDSDLEVTNIEREIIFHYQNRKFKIVLSAPRS